MPPKIQFPEVDPRYVSERDCLEFPATRDGKPVRCLITAELLMARFGARDMFEEAMRRAFEEHKSEIRAIARDHIANGWVDPEGSIILTTRFTQLTVTFADRLKEWPEGYEEAVKSNRILAEILGPNAEEVTVVWDREAFRTDPVSLVLHISDPTIPISTTCHLRSKDLLAVVILRGVLAGAWGSILRRRFEKLISRFG